MRLAWSWNGENQEAERKTKSARENKIKFPTPSANLHVLSERKEKIKGGGKRSKKNSLKISLKKPCI